MEKARRAIENESVRLVRASELYTTPAFPEGSGPDYINACWMLETSLGPSGFLRHLHVIERQFSRKRDERWGARTLDLDLLAFGDEVLPNTEVHTQWRKMPLENQLFQAPEVLVLPHPRIQDRAFVLVPLNEIAPKWRHPVTGLTTTQMLARCPQSQIEAIKPAESLVQKLVKGSDRG